MRPVYAFIVLTVVPLLTLAMSIIAFAFPEDPWG